MYTVSIDAGGTMTDGIVASDEGFVTVKVDSTPHDLTLSLMECLSDAGSQMGFPDMNAFLEQVKHIRELCPKVGDGVIRRRFDVA